MSGDRRTGPGRLDGLEADSADLEGPWPGKRSLTVPASYSGPVDPGKRSTSHSLRYRPEEQFELRVGEATTVMARLERAIEARDFSDALGATCTLRRCLGDLQTGVATTQGPDRALRARTLTDITERSQPLLARAPVVSDRAWKEHTSRAPGTAWATEARQWSASLGGAPASRVPDAVVDALESETGASLPDPSRWSKQAGGDVGHARIVTGPKAAAAAASIGARAFTVGHRVFFSGGHDVDTDGGKLLAHELAHVVQQKGAPQPSSWNDLPILDASHPHELEARAGAAASTSAIAIARDTGITADDMASDGHFAQTVSGDLSSMEFMQAAPWAGLLPPAFKQEFQELIAKRGRVVAARGGGKTEVFGPARSFADLIAPESIETLIDRARGMDWATDKDDQPVQLKTGKWRDAYERSAAIEITNAIVRRYKESIARVFPRFVSSYIKNKPSVKIEVVVDGKPVDTYTVKPEAVLASHPLDVYVIDALCRVQSSFDLPKLATIPELAGADIVSKRTVNVEMAPFIGDEPLPLWAKAPDDATPEEVAQTLFGKPELANLLLDERPMFGFRLEAVARMTAKAQAERSARIAKFPYRDAYGDPLEELSRHGRDDDAHRMGLKDDAAMPAGKDMGSIAELLAGNLRVLEVIRSMLRGLKVSDHDVQEAIGWVSIKQAKTEGGRFEFKSAAGGYALVDKQSQLLSRISIGLATAASKLTEQGGMAYAPVIEVAEVMSSAISGLEFPHSAEPRVARGEQLVANIDISIEEARIHDALPRAQRALEAGEDSSFDADKAERGLSGGLDDLMQLRVTAAVDPAKATKKVAELREPIKNLTFDVSINDKLTQLNLLWSAIDGTDDSFWVPIDDKVDGLSLKRMNRWWYMRFFNEVYITFTVAKASKNETVMKTARDAFDKLVGDKDFIQHAKDVIQHLETSNKHKRWSKIIVALAITVVAFALGQWEFAGLIEAGFLPAEAAVAAGVTTTAVNMALNKVILNQGPGSAGEIITGFVGNIATFYVIGKLAMAARAAALEEEVASGTSAAARAMEGGAKAPAGAGKAATIGEKVGDFAADAAHYAKGLAKEAILAEAIGYVQVAIANKIDGKPMPQGEELEDMFVQQLVGVVGMRIGNHMLEGGMEAYKAIAEHDRVNVDWLIRERGELQKLAKEVAKAHDNPYGKPERAKAEELMSRWKEYLQRERQVRERVLADAAKRPNRYNQKDIAKLKKLPADNVLESQLDQATALLGIEQYGPSLYRCNSHAFDALLEQQHAAGGEIVKVATDPKTGQRTMTIKASDGTQLVVTEKLPDVGHRTAPPVPIAEARSFEQWLDGDATKRLKPDQVRALRERYAKDPEAAIAIAAHDHGYTPTAVRDPAPLVHPDAPETLKTKGSTKGPTAPDVPSTPISTKLTPIGKGRFETPAGNLESSRKGFAASKNEVTEIHYDPKENVAYYDAEIPTPSGPRKMRVQASLGDRVASVKQLAGAKNQVVGKPVSLDDGHVILDALNKGDGSVLSKLGLKGVDKTTKAPHGTEFGLAETSDGRAVIVVGEGMEVDWTHLPGMKPDAHIHPDVAGNNLQGRSSIHINELLVDGNPLAELNRKLVFPSAADFIVMAIIGVDGHTVYTPFIVKDGVVMKPTAGDASPRLKFKIRNPEKVGMSGGKEVYRATLEGTNGVELTQDVWVTRDGTSLNGDIHMTEPPDLVRSTGDATLAPAKTQATTKAPPPEPAKVQPVFEKHASDALAGVKKAPPYSVKVLKPEAFEKRFGKVKAAFTVENDTNVIYAASDAERADIVAETYKVRQMADSSSAKDVRTRWDDPGKSWGKRSFADRLDAFRRRLDIELDAYGQMVKDKVPGAGRVLERLRYYEHAVDGLTDKLPDLKAGRATEPDFLKDPNFAFTKDDLVMPREDRHGAFAKNDKVTVGDSSAKTKSTTVYQLGQQWTETELVVSRHTGSVAERTVGKQRMLVVTESGVEHFYPLEPKAEVVKKKSVTAGEVMADETRNYRLVEIHDGKTVTRREEIQMSDDSWIKRGSDSTRAGSIAEAASRLQVNDALDARKATAIKNKKYFDWKRLPGGRGGGGFDDVIAEFTPPKDRPKAKVRVREVKDYPNRYVPLAEFTAIHGPDLVENIKILEKRVNDALTALDKGDPSRTPPGFEGLDEHQLVAIRDAITNGEIQFEIVLSEGTKLGVEGGRDDSVLTALRGGIENAGHGKLALLGKTTDPNTKAPERVDPKWVKQATDAKVAEEKSAKKAGTK